MSGTVITERGGGQCVVYAAALYRALILQFQGRTKDTIQRIDNRGILNNINYFLQSFALEMA